MSNILIADHLKTQSPGIQQVIEDFLNPGFGKEYSLNRGQVQLIDSSDTRSFTVKSIHLVLLIVLSIFTVIALIIREIHRAKLPEISLPLNKDDTVTTTPSSGRAFIARKHTEIVREQNDAATAISSAYRGFLKRREVQAHKRTLYSNASKIRNAWRRKLIMIRVRKLQNKKFTILIAGNTSLGLGDYQKQAAIYRMLTQAGYTCKIRLRKDAILKNYLMFIDENCLTKSTHEYYLPPDIHPDLIISSPIDYQVSVNAKGAKIPILKIYEYNANRVTLKEDIRSGMDGLGIILDHDQRKKYQNPYRHLLDLPEIYTHTIVGKDFNKFTHESEFYLGYTYEAGYAATFIKAISDDRIECPQTAGAPKELCFYFMGNNLIDSREGRWSTPAQVKEIFRNIRAKSISMVHILNGSGIKMQDVPQFTEDPTAPEIRIITGWIQGSFVPRLMSAAKELLVTGDGSLSQAYAIGKVPLFYEALPHKVYLRQRQLELIFDTDKINHPTYQPRDFTGLGGTDPERFADRAAVPVLDNSYQRTAQPERIKNAMKGFYENTRTLLVSSRNQYVQKRLRNHLSYVHNKLNFRKNLLKLVRQTLRLHSEP